MVINSTNINKASNHLELISDLHKVVWVILYILKIWLFINDNHWSMYSVISYHLFFMYLRSTLIHQYVLLKYTPFDGWICFLYSWGGLYGRDRWIVAIKIVHDLRQAGGFLRVLRFPPQIKLTAMIKLKYCWKWH